VIVILFGFMSRQRRTPLSTVRIAARSALSQETDQLMLVEFMVFLTSWFILSMQIPLFPRECKNKSYWELFFPPVLTQMVYDNA